MRRLLVLLTCLLVFMLAACSQDFELRTHQISFDIRGQVQTQTVIEEECPRIPDLPTDGPDFVGWKNAEGQMVDPGRMVATEDATYTAVFQPMLTNRSPYLFMDANGMLRPDDVMTYGEVKQALAALHSSEEQVYYPDMPGDNEKVTNRGTHTILSWFYGRDNLPQMPDEYVTRAQFAVAMDQMLGWPTSGRVTVTGELPKDVSMDRPDLEAILRASVAYTDDPNGKTWQELDLPTSYAPGFVNIDGYLYCVEEDGTFLRDADKGVLHFDGNGRFTLGDAELDTQIAEYLKGVVEGNPNATRLDLLRIAFDHCYQDFKYLRKASYPMGKTGWEIEDAKDMLESGRGNCYGFAALFWAYARMLGYEARAVSGTCTDTDQAHGWVIINIDGEDYFFDPQWQYAYIDRGVTNKDMFQIPMNRIDYWTYKWKE